MTDTFEVKQGVDPNYLRNTLTKDITALEAIFDLVDNAVDGARERLLGKRGTKLDQYGLPNDYSGFRIDVEITKSALAISDNCIGISETNLAQHAFVTGLISEHRYGIGGFGIGLKRALFRLGSTYELSTDTGKAAAQMHFDKTQLSDASIQLVASRAVTAGTTKTRISISDLEHGVLHEFSTKSSIGSLIKNLSRRYGLYLKKGLQIRVNKTKVPPFGPSIRQSGPVKSQSRHQSTPGGVRIFIDSGMHDLYRVTNEKDYNSAKNAELTDQYGWYFVCNDRIVKIASHEKELGWTTNWHQEYYGFIGWIRFVAEEPTLLPWDTKKTLIDPNSPAFRAISSDLQTLADQYRTENKQARKGKSTTQLPLGGLSPINPTIAKQSTETTDRLASSKKRDPKDHNENWDTLLPILDVRPNHHKLRALVHEATGLSITNPYAGSMLFRVIVEFALVEHLRRTRRYQTVRAFYFQEQSGKGRELSDQQKKDFRPTLAHALEWLGKNEDYFPEEVRRECTSARNKFSKHLKELNRIVHEGDLTNSEKLKIVRDDALPLLQFLLKGS